MAGRFCRQIDHNFPGLAPIYIQAGGRETLRDIIAEFAEMQVANGASIQSGNWDDMLRIFQAYDSTQTPSACALDGLAKTFRSFVDVQMKGISSQILRAGK